MSISLAEWLEQRNKLFEKEPDEIDPTLRECPMCLEWKHEVTTRRVGEHNQYSCEGCHADSIKFLKNIESEDSRSALITHSNGMEDVVVGTYKQILDIWSQSPASAIRLEFIK